MSITEIKKKSLAVLEYKWETVIFVQLLFLAIAIFVELPIEIVSEFIKIDGQLGLIGVILSFVTFILSLSIRIIKVVLNYGVIFIYLRISREQSVKFTDVFIGFKKVLSILWLGIVSMFFIFLWLLLFIIPGLMKIFSYSQIYRVKIDNPDMSAMECLKESERIMLGNRMDLVMLQISFIGWILLIPLTFGLIGFWLMPYIETSKTIFYNNLKEIKNKEVINELNAFEQNDLVEGEE